MSLEIISINEARENKIDIDYHPSEPNMMGIKSFSDYPVQELIDYIDWTPFFNGWGLKGKYPDIFEKDKTGCEAQRIYREAQRILKRIVKEQLIRPKGVFGLFPANSRCDDIFIYDHRGKTEEPLATIPMLRQQVKHKYRDNYLSLSDFIAPVKSGVRDFIGMFVVTAGQEAEHYTGKLKKENDIYNSLMFRFIADRLTEAFAEFLHERVRKEFWGYAPSENLTKDELIQEKYEGTRPAPGYPACPDHSLKDTIFDLLQVEQRIGVTLTSGYVMKPVSSVSGFYFAHPESNYFRVGKISTDQLIDYAKRNQLPYNSAENLLCASLVNRPHHLTDQLKIEDN